SAIAVAIALGIAAVALAGGPELPSAELVQAPSVPSLASQRIYFVMVDRYANGDPSNDRGGRSGLRSVTGFDPASSGWYHGGDLKGLTGDCADTRHGLG